MIPKKGWTSISAKKGSGRKSPKEALQRSDGGGRPPRGEPPQRGAMLMRVLLPSRVDVQSFELIVVFELYGAMVADGRGGTIAIDFLRD